MHFFMHTATGCLITDLACQSMRFASEQIANQEPSQAERTEGYIYIGQTNRSRERFGELLTINRIDFRTDGPRRQNRSDLTFSVLHNDLTILFSIYRLKRINRTLCPHGISHPKPVSVRPPFGRGELFPPHRVIFGVTGPIIRPQFYIGEPINFAPDGMILKWNFLALMTQDPDRGFALPDPQNDVPPVEDIEDLDIQPLEGTLPSRGENRGGNT